MLSAANKDRILGSEGAVTALTTAMMTHSSVGNVRQYARGALQCLGVAVDP